MKQIDFDSSSISLNILQTAFPMFIAQAVNLLYSIVDRIYIGRIPGEGTAALGGIGLVFPIITLITAFTNLYGSGGAPLFAISRGQGDSRRASRLLNTAFRLEILTGILLTAIGFLFGRPILYAFGASDQSIIYAWPYLRIYIWGTLFVMISTGMNPFINAQGFSQIGMISVVIGAVCNIVLDPLFIFTLGFGIRGAAAATVISQGLSAAFVLRFLLSPNSSAICRVTLKMPTAAAMPYAENAPAAAMPYTENARTSAMSYAENAPAAAMPYAKNAPAASAPLHTETAGKLSAADIFPNPRLTLSITSLGLAAFVMQFTNSLVTIVCNNTLMAYSSELYVSVMTLLSSLRQVLELPAISIVEGSSPVLSYNYGAGHANRVRRAIFIMSAADFIYTALGWLLVERAPRLLLSIFTTDESLISATLPAMHLYFMAFVFMALQHAAQSTFKALNKKRRAIFFSIFRKVIMVVPLTILLPRVIEPPVNGVFSAEPISNLIGGSASFIVMLLTVLPELKRMEQHRLLS